LGRCKFQVGVHFAAFFCIGLRPNLFTHFVRGEEEALKYQIITSGNEFFMNANHWESKDDGTLILYSSETYKNAEGDQVTREDQIAEFRPGAWYGIMLCKEDTEEEGP